MISELKTHHREIARLRFEGLKPSDIATRTDTNYQTTCKILRDPLCLAYIEGLNDKADAGVIDVRKRLSKMNSAALNVLDNLLDPNAEKSIPASVKFSAAKDVLDRNGHKPVERSTNIDIHITSDDIKEMRQRQIELRDKKAIPRTIN